MRLERTLGQGLVQYRLLDEEGNEVEEVFTVTGEEDERDMWLAGYIRLAEKYDEEIEGLKPGEPLWALHPEGSPVSNVFSYCRNCGRLFSAEQITAAIKKADKTRGPLGDEELARLSLFCPDYDPDGGCGRGTEGVPQWQFGSL
jgi:hypothetical protein